MVSQRSSAAVVAVLALTQAIMFVIVMRDIDLAFHLWRPFTYGRSYSARGSWASG